MGGKSDAPKSDPSIGQAALKSAETGAAYLDYMKQQAGITNQWATEDRSRAKTVYEPLEDYLVKESKVWDSPQRQKEAMDQARADVMRNAANSNKQRLRTLSAIGVNPASGRYAGIERAANIETALGAADAENDARARVVAERFAMLGNAVNMGKGLAVNPLASIQTSNNAASSGFQGAQQGYGQQAGILNQDFNNRLQSYQANQQSNAALWQGVGGLVGMAFGSDENIKEGKKPAKGLLKAVEGMRVDEWKYKDGEGDGGKHVGTYAQDFARETGHGDGKTIDVISAIGTTMGAVKELSAKVDKLAGGKKRSIMTERAMA